MKVYQVILKKIVDDEKFQFTLYSDGVNKDEIEELRNKFNRISQKATYSYFKLKSGRYSFIKTTYDEKERTYICHSLIFDGMLDFYSANLTDFSEFIHENKTEKLEVLEDISANRIIGDEKLFEFIRPLDSKIIRDMVNAVVGFSINKRSINIIDREDRLIYWLYLIQISFLEKASNKITFTTHEALSEDSDFIIHFLTKSIPNEDKYIFDFLKEIKAVVNEDYKFSELVEIGYFGSWQTLKNYHRFLEGFEYELVNEELDDSYTLFILLNIGTVTIQSMDSNRALKFLLKYSQDDNIEGIFEGYNQNLSKIVNKMDREGCFLLSEIIFKGISKSHNAALYEVGVNILIDIIDHISNNIKSKGDNYSIFNKYFNENKGKSVFLKYFVSPERVKYFIDMVINEHKESLPFYLYTVINSGVEMGYSWSQFVNVENMDVFIDASSKQTIGSKDELKEIINASSKSDDIFVHMILLFCNRVSNNQQFSFILKSYVDILDEFNDERNLNIRREIYKLQGGKILIEEFKERLQLSRDKVSFFKEYTNEIFYKIPDYYNKYFSEAVRSYIVSLPKETAYAEALKFIDLFNDNTSIFDEKTLKSIVISFEKGIDISRIDEIKDRITIVKKAKKLGGIQTFPDITSLIDFIYYLENEEIELRDAADELNLNLGYLSRDNYKIYINICIPKIIKHIKSKEDHNLIVHFLNCGEDEDGFFREYIHIIEDTLRDNLNLGYGILKSFISYYLFYLEARYRLIGEEEIIENIEEYITDIISSKSREFIIKLDRDIRNEFNENGYSIPIKWSEIFSKAMDSKSFRNKLINIFKKER